MWTCHGKACPLSSEIVFFKCFFCITSSDSLNSAIWPNWVKNCSSGKYEKYIQLYQKWHFLLPSQTKPGLELEICGSVGSFHHIQTVVPFITSKFRFFLYFFLNCVFETFWSRFKIWSGCLAGAHLEFWRLRHKKFFAHFYHNFMEKILKILNKSGNLVNFVLN
jgi:hypothetical protein